MRKNRPSCNKITYVFIPRLDLICLLIFFLFCTFGTSNKLFQPFPSIHIQLINMFFDLWGFEGKPFSKYKAHSSSNTVCSYPLQISVPFHLGFFSWIPIYANRAVSHYQTDFIFRRCILQTCNSFIKQYFFHIALYLLWPWFIAPNSDPASYIITNKYRKSLRCSSCASDGPGIKYSDILRTIVVFPELDLGNSLNRSCNNSFCEGSHGNPNCSFNCILFSSKDSDFAFCNLAPDLESSLFPRHLCLKMPDLFCNSFDSYKVLNPICKILREENFYNWLWISPTGPSPVCNLDCVLEPSFESIEIFVHFLTCNSFTHFRSLFKKN